jgi:chemotaxis protein MotB
MSAPSKTSSTARSRSPRSARVAALAAAAGLAFGASGCITRAAHQKAMDELRTELTDARDDARAKQRSIDAIEAERDKLLAEIEDLRDARESLQQDVTDREQKIVKLRTTYDALVEDLEADVNANALHIERLTEGMSFRLPQDVLFPPASADLTTAGKQAVRDVAGRIGTGDDRVEVQGHTDDRALKGGGRYPTNWELAGARAASVVRVLEEAGVDPKRLSAVSYGSNRPLVSNETPEGRAQNRRIEVRLVPSGPAMPSPGAPSASAPPPEGQPAPEASAPPPEGQPAPEASAPPPAPKDSAPHLEVEAQGARTE